MKVELFVTEKGGNAKNTWKEGQAIKVHPGIAKQLIEKGFASEDGVAKKTKPKKEDK